MKIFENDNSIAVFSDRTDGDLNFYALNREQQKATWEKLISRFDVNIDLPLYVNQVHQDKIALVNSNIPFPTPQTQADGLITNLSHKAVGIFTADCCPILISSKKAVSATHAGWKSTLQSISYKTVSSFEEKYNIKSNELIAYIGPCIGQCCFEVGDEVYESFYKKDEKYKGYFVKYDKWHLDLRGINKYQLIKAGIPENQIIDFNECTYCLPEKYFSYRKMKKRNGSMFSFIFLK